MRGEGNREEPLGWHTLIALGSHRPLLAGSVELGPFGEEIQGSDEGVQCVAVPPPDGSTPGAPLFKPCLRFILDIPVSKAQRRAGTPLRRQGDLQ